VKHWARTFTGWNSYIQ